MPFLVFSVSLFLNIMTAFAALPLAQNNHASVNTTGLLKVNIVYYRDFPYKKDYANQQLKNCITLFKAGIIRCKEQVSLLRPEKIVKGWQQTRNKKGYLPFVLKKYGITHVKAHITEVTPAESAHMSKNSSMPTSPYAPVTGIFIRHVLDVRQYTFKNLKTNVVFFVTATPDHPVYAVNRQAFIGISQLSPEDTLLSARGEKIELVCPDNAKNGCGTAFNRGKITSVYNIESSQRHTYFVQSENMLVHNCGSKATTEDEPDSEDPISLSAVSFRQSVSLVTKNLETGEIVGEFDRYGLSSIRELREKKHDSWELSPTTRQLILRVRDHAGYEADYSRISSLSLDNDGRLNITGWLQRKKLVTRRMQGAIPDNSAITTSTSASAKGRPSGLTISLGLNLADFLASTGWTGYETGEIFSHIKFTEENEINPDANIINRGKEQRLPPF